MSEKGLDPSTSSGHRFRDAHLKGMALFVEEDIALDPIDVSLLGANGIVLDPDSVTHLIQ